MEVSPDGSLRFCGSGKAVHTLGEEEEAALEHNPQEWRHHEQSRRSVTGLLLTCQRWAQSYWRCRCDGGGVSYPADVARVHVSANF